MYKRNALIVVDMQNDFIEHGALAVNSFTATNLENIKNLMQKFHEKEYIIVATQDWHPDNHCSFKENGGPWPKHCVQGSSGADLIQGLPWHYCNAIIRKGMKQDIDSYSAFMDNDKKTRTGLEGFIDDHVIQNVYICGLALDYCVKWTADDAYTSGFSPFIVEDASAAIDPNSPRSAEIKYINTDDKLLK
jgi:nicotinamidase/pyrazinamidase